MNNKQNNLLKTFFIIILILTIILLWARYINTKGLKVVEYSIINKKIPLSYHGLKIVHISDILYGNTTNLKDLKNIVKKTNELNPDIVIFTGDLVNSNITLSDKEYNKISNELNKIETKLYKYAIPGDHDLKSYNEYKNSIENAGFILLNNSNELLHYESITPLKIVGLTDIKDIENAFKQETEGELFTLLLMHQPDNITKLNNYQVDIAFAGHSLGGQLKVPFLGGVIKKDGARTYLDKEYKINDTTLYVSSGIGTENLKFRTFNKPSINLYRLYNK